MPDRRGDCRRPLRGPSGSIVIIEREARLSGFAYILRSELAMSLLRGAARRLGLGKYRYWQGTDLQGAYAGA